MSICWPPHHRPMLSGWCLDIMTGVSFHYNSLFSVSHVKFHLSLRWVPKEFYEITSNWKHIFENDGVVQFDHRMLAYTTVLANAGQRWLSLIGSWPIVVSHWPYCHYLIDISTWSIRSNDRIKLNDFSSFQPGFGIVEAFPFHAHLE